jgi:hypothetical protein
MMAPSVPRSITLEIFWAFRDNDVPLARLATAVETHIVKDPSTPSTRLTNNPLQQNDLFSIIAQQPNFNQYRLETLKVTSAQF